jgi:hypothetical protein
VPQLNLPDTNQREQRRHAVAVPSAFCCTCSCCDA